MTDVLSTLAGLATMAMVLHYAFSPERPPAPSWSLRDLLPRRFRTDP